MWIGGGLGKRSLDVLQWLWIGLAAGLCGSACVGVDGESGGPGTGRGSGAVEVGDHAAKPGEGGAGVGSGPLIPNAEARQPLPAQAFDGGGVLDGGCASISQTTEPEVVVQDVTDADLIWVVDSSCSMVDEALRVQNNLNAFTDFVEDSDISARVAMVTQAGFVTVPNPLGADTSRYMFIDRAVGSQDGLQILLDTFPLYQSFLRADAPTHFVAVTDDESALPAALFRDQMVSLLGHEFTFHAIASPDTSSPGPCNNLWGSACPGAANPGCQYVQLAQQTSGEFVSICTPAGQWPDILENLGSAVKESVPVALPCDYVVPKADGSKGLDPNEVNVRYTPTGGAPEYFGRVQGAAQCGDNPAWFYDDPSTPSRISLCPASCQAVSTGGEIRMVFGCETILVTVD